MKERKEILYLIISILTLVIMGLGATFAFFTMNVNEKNKENILATSAKVKVNLKVLTLYTGYNILPTNDEDIEKAFKNECIDSIGNGACLAYTIEIDNDGNSQSGYLSFKFNSETLENLKFILLDNDNNYNIIQNPTYAVDGEVKVNEIINMNTNDVKKYTLVVWLSNIKENEQNKEQGGDFTAMVSYSSSSGSRITGSMNQTIN